MIVNYCLRLLFSLTFCLLSGSIVAQVTGSITVGGDFDKFYPTVWNDAGWSAHLASELEIGRSETHLNSSWRGTVIAKFNIIPTLGEMVQTSYMQTSNKPLMVAKVLKT
jgi:hypothetical protein